MKKLVSFSPWLLFLGPLCIAAENYHVEFGYELAYDRSFLTVTGPGADPVWVSAETRVLDINPVDLPIIGYLEGFSARLQEALNQGKVKLRDLAPLKKSRWETGLRNSLLGIRVAGVPLRSYRANFKTLRPFRTAMQITGPGIEDAFTSRLMEHTPRSSQQLNWDAARVEDALNRKDLTLNELEPLLRSNFEFFGRLWTSPEWQKMSNEPAVFRVFIHQSANNFFFQVTGPGMGEDHWIMLPASLHRTPETVSVPPQFLLRAEAAYIESALNTGKVKMDSLTVLRNQDRTGKCTAALKPTQKKTASTE